MKSHINPVLNSEAQNSKNDCLESDLGRMPKYYSGGILDNHREATETATEEIETNLFIGGEFRKPESGEYFETRDPAIDEPIVEIARGKATDIDNAVIATKEAADEWMTPSFQNKIIFVIDSNFDLRLINENK